MLDVDDLRRQVARIHMRADACFENEVAPESTDVYNSIRGKLRIVCFIKWDSDCLEDARALFA